MPKNRTPRAYRLRSKTAIFLQDALESAIDALAERTFRSIVFSASSIPRSLGKSADGQPVRILNAEYAVWSRLTGSRIGRHIRFGDNAARYAHQSDKAPKASPPARINLVTPSSHVLCVGDSTSYRDLAKKVIGEPEFEQQFGCWGKYAVRDAASGRDGVGNATEWVARDTQMHIETISAAAKTRLVEQGEVFGAASENAYAYEQGDLGF